MGNYPEAVTQRDQAFSGPPAESSRRLRTLSAEGTKAVAASLAGWLEPGDVVVLSGDLGAGKTTFTQGRALGLAVTDPGTSPTFAILQQYDGTQHTQGSQRTLVINHLDVYRLGTLDEAEALGLDELLDGEAVTLVEWGEAIETLLGPSRLVVTLQLAPVDDDGEPDAAGSDALDQRVVTLELLGTERRRHQSLDRALAQALDDRGVALEGEEPC
mgnify:CR=1 FL=1